VTRLMRRSTLDQLVTVVDGIEGLKAENRRLRALLNKIRKHCADPYLHGSTARSNWNRDIVQWIDVEIGP
jgi:hypothetical protein